MSKQGKTCEECADETTKEYDVEYSPRGCDNCGLHEQVNFWVCRWDYYHMWDTDDEEEVMGDMDVFKCKMCDWWACDRCTIRLYHNDAKDLHKHNENNVVNTIKGH